MRGVDWSRIGVGLGWDEGAIYGQKGSVILMWVGVSWREKDGGWILGVEGLFSFDC